MNPFTQRGRITDVRRFVGRWRELSVVFDRLAEGRPVLLTGAPGIGKSSLLTHVAQSAAVNLERPDLQAFYMDLSVLPDVAACYRLMAQGLGSRGETAEAIELITLQRSAPVLFCMDRADTAMTAGWGADMLERMARLARRSFLVGQGSRAMGEERGLLLAVVVNGKAPVLSEPFARVGLGAVAAAEIRLFTDAYLEGTGVQFTPPELHELAVLSMGHPAYLQRAAYHLFESRQQPGYDWRSAYLDEAHERPIPGAPLPPAVFEGEEVESTLDYQVYYESLTATPALQTVESGGAGELAGVLLPLIAALLAWQASASWLVGLGVLGAGFLLVVLVVKVRTKDT